MIHSATGWRRRLTQLGTLAVNAILPPRCLACGDAVPSQGDLCATCWSGLRFLHEPWCRRCGVPLPFEDPLEPTCGECRQRPPAYDRARAAVAYERASGRLVIGFKHHDRIEAASTFARWMQRAGAELLGDADLILPVPLHRWRLWHRGYNQSGLLAKHLALLTGVPWAPDALLRARATTSQQRLGARARRNNITADVFLVSAERNHLVRGRKVLLIDDVLTTGATVGACVAVLREAGAVTVDVLTLSRVVQAHALPISS